jgi:O-antigen ligase
VTSFIFILIFLAAGMTAGMLVSRHTPHLLFSGAGAGLLFMTSFLNPAWGMYLLILSMLLSPEFSVGATAAAGSLSRGVTLRLDDFILLVIGLSWFARSAYFKEVGLFKKTPLNRPIFCYVLACLISTALGVMGGKVDPKTGFFFVLKYIEYFIVFFMVVNYAEDLDQVKRLIFCLFLTCFITSIIGMLQIPGGGRVSAPFEGEIGEPNTFGGYLLFIGAVAGGLLSTSQDPRVRLGLMFLLAVMLLPFLYTHSRSSYLAFIPAFLILGAMTRKRGLVIGVMLAALVISPLFLPSSVKNRIGYTFKQPVESGQIKVGEIRLDTSTSARIQSWGEALKAWTRRPLTGYGVTGFGFIDAQYPRVLTETGLLGMAAFLYLIGSIFNIAFSNLAVLKDRFALGITRGFIAGYAGLLCHAIGANTFIIVRIMEPFWFVAGIVLILPELTAPPRPEPV